MKTKVTIYSICLGVVFVLSLVFSIVMWKNNFPGVRRTFLFQSASSDSLIVENRYLPNGSAQDKIKNYIDELLLGSISERCQNIFVRGTKLISCFERNNQLYVEFSDDFINADPISTDFDANFSLFCKNIRQNFSHIYKIYIFVNGTQVFESQS